MNVDKDTQDLISETINKFVNNNLTKKGSRPQEYDICPHCNTEICEKHTYSDDGGNTMRHSECGEIIEYPETPLNEVSPWLRPYVEAARKEKQVESSNEYPQDKEMMNLSGEAKYSKQQPGGEMQAMGLIETHNGDTTEEIVIDSMDYGKMFNGQIRTVNLSNLPLKFKTIRITRDTANAFIIEVSNA